MGVNGTIHSCEVCARSFIQMTSQKQHLFELAMRSIKPNYMEHMDCRPPPIFMIFVSVVEVRLTIFLISYSNNWHIMQIRAEPQPYRSSLLYDSTIQLMDDSTIEPYNHIT